MAYALITGASKGIGKAIASRLAERGYDLFLIARSENLLAELSKDLQQKNKIKVTVLGIDLSTDAAIDLIARKIESEQMQIQILVNNAGYGLWGRFDTLSLSEQEAMLRINTLTMVRLTYLVLPYLKKQPSSYILNVASTAAYQAVPTLAVYAASKAFVLNFTRGLRYELKNSGVSVTCLSPGPTETNFMNAAGMHSQKMIRRAKKFNMQAEEVAAFALKGMFAGKKEIIPGFINRVSAWMTALTPKSLTEKIAAGLYE
ncbi:MAG TPA: SDR family oxidoreductase [Bacteroidia bacterium]|nr:SDR family oxidoreductase [Bacteroidia bacterium]